MIKNNKKFNFLKHPIYFLIIIFFYIFVIYFIEILLNIYDISGYINKYHISIIDLNEELFKNYEDTLSLFPFRVNGHYNELGYKLISNVI